MATAMDKRLGELLVKEKVISTQDLEGALETQRRTGASLGRVVQEMGLANEWEVAAVLGKQLNVPFISLSQYAIDPEVLHSIPEDIIRKYKIVPVDRTENALTVALSDPSDIYVIDELRLLTKTQIIPVISFESDIEEAIRTYYDGNGSSKYDEMLKDISDEDIAIIHDDLKTESGSDDGQNDLAVDASDAPVIQLVNLIVHEAIKMRASDIHIEPYEKMLRLRYRVDGHLQEMTPPPKKFQNAIISRIKILSEMDIAERRLPQDGRFKVRLEKQAIDFRVSCLPTVHGEKIVIRILNQSSIMMSLTDLGFAPEALAKFQKEIVKPWGMILVTGPTGSGKSTTLYAALSTINSPTKNIITIEDPVEYQLLGINQVQIKPDIGLTFAEGLRSFLRQDPDIIMVGEIRDLETAEIAVKAALTGHLVFATLHTNDAPSSVNRLTNMGIEPFLVTASVNMIVAQRLVRRICEQCKEPVKPAAELLESLGIKEDPAGIRFYKGVGCSRCHSGYKGRVALYEALCLTDHLRDLIIEGVSSTQLKQAAIAEGMVTLRQAGILKIREGMTTIEEVLSATAADSA
ncbi:MAG: type IV-A pilus assembly ATPase PilB [Candidatus Sumerlaeota bacterium]|nr:type IV-A pilus assembly ATPase PilB [Candidatus Sumerlaeota bacterium]